MADASLVPFRASGVAWIEIDAEIVALDLSGRAHVISSAGALLWPLLDGVATAGELASDVADVFGIDGDAALADVVRLVDEMVGLDLVRAPPNSRETSR